MKKVFVALLACFLFLAGCVQPSVSSSGGDVITIVVPREYVDLIGLDVKDLQNSGEEAGFASVHGNDDGTVTISMTKDKQRELLEELARQIEAFMQELKENGEQYVCIKDIKAHDDYACFTVTLSKDKVGVGETMAMYLLFAFGIVYGILEGDGKAVQVDFVDSNGRLIQSGDSSSLSDLLSNFLP